MDNNDAIQKYLQEYIKGNRETYSSDILRTTLLNAGHQNDEIDAAFKALDMNPYEKGKVGGMPSASKKHGSGNWRDAPTSWGHFMIMFPGIPLLSLLLISLAYTISYQLADFLWLATIGGTFLVGMFLPMNMKHKNPSGAKGIMYGFRTLLVIFVVFPIVAFGVLLGICMVLLSTV